MDEKKTKKENKDCVHAVGRRREAIARIRLYGAKAEVSWGEATLKPGDVYVNGVSIIEYFGSELGKNVYEEVFKTTNTVGKYIATIKVSGGGKSGQIDAVVLGLSNALSAIDTEVNRPLLKKKGFLTRDPRVRERRKAGKGGKARRKRQSPKR